MAIIGAHPERGIRFILERAGRMAEAFGHLGQIDNLSAGADSVTPVPVPAPFPVSTRAPSSGRIAIAPVQAFTPPYHYEGFAFTPKEKHRLVVDVLADGTVDIGGDAPDDIQDKTRLLMRMFVRHAESEGTAPPRRILRWRPDA